MNNELQGHKKSDTVKWVLTCIAFILVFAVITGLCLQVFGTDNTKPSEWFKAERKEASAINVHDIEGDVDLASKSVRSYASTYATTEAVIPPCEHLPQTIKNMLLDTGRGNQNLTLRTAQSTTFCIQDRNLGSSLSDSAYFAEYTGSSISSYFTTAIWCFHGIKSYFVNRYGYFFTDFEIDWNNSDFSSDWNKLSSKPSVQESYDALTDTLTLKVEEAHTYNYNEAPPMLHFPSTGITFTAVKADYSPHGAGLCNHVQYDNYSESNGAHSSLIFEKKSESGNFSACFFDRATGRQLFALDDNAIAQYAASNTANGQKYWYTDAYICIHDVILRAEDKGVRISNIGFVYPGEEEEPCGNPEESEGRLSVKVRISGSGSYPLVYPGGGASYKFYVDAEAMDGWQLLPPDPVKTGYTFSGWYYDEDYTELFEGGMVSEDMTLYAGWTINVYTLTLDANGGMLDYGKETVSGDYNTVPVIPVPERYGYTFSGWQTEDGQTYDVETPLTKDLTLTAQWQINTYTLTLDANGGEVNPVSVTGEYDTVPEIPVPVRTGYTFTGWKTSTGSTYSTERHLTENLTLVAQWEINTYTIVFNANGGEVNVSSVSGEYNTVPAIPTPTRRGHTFLEWKTADGKAYDLKSPFTQDLTLVAQWKINTYTVTFIVDGVLYDTMSVEYGTKLSNIAQSVEPALFMTCSFDEAGVSLASDYAIEGDITVHAEKGTTAQQAQGKWKKIAIGGACGAVMIAIICYIPFMIKCKKRKD